ncbi:MAG: SPOR domain-containing protein [Bacillota bacterium]|nr:SPOR domain-containing protein [Bacillota bacterium]
MKKSTKSLIVVVVLIFSAPLIGYFGTKYILLSINSSGNNLVIEEPAVEEDIPKENESNEYTYQLTLDELTLSMVQLASIGSKENADTFIQSENISAFVFKKDGLYKVVYSAYFGNNNIESVLDDAKEIVGDAFITSGVIPEKTIEVKSDKEIEIDLLRDTVSEFYSVLGLFDDMASKIINEESTKSLRNTINDRFVQLLDREVWNNSFGDEFVTIIQDALAISQKNHSTFSNFNKEYINLLQRIFNVYE